MKIHFSKNVKINIMFAGMLFCSIAVPFFLPFAADMSLYSQLLLSQILMQLSVVVYLAATGTNPVKLISFKPIHILSVPTLIIMTYCVLPLTSTVNLISQLFVPNALMDLSENMMGGSVWVNLLFVAVMPALSEEFAFRGVIFHSLKKDGCWFAVVMSAFFFGMLHLNFNQFSYTFVIGMVMALAVVATGSIWGSVVVHFTLNANSVLLLKLISYLKRLMAGLAGSDMENVMNEAVSTAEMVPAIILLGVLSLIMLIPAACFLYISSSLNGRKEELMGMITKKRTKANAGAEGKKRERRIFDLVFAACLIIAFGWMILIML